MATDETDAGMLTEADRDKAALLARRYLDALVNGKPAMSAADIEHFAAAIDHLDQVANRRVA